MLQTKGITIGKNFAVSQRAHLDPSRIIRRSITRRNNPRGHERSARPGVGSDRPMRDKMARIGILMGDLLNPPLVQAENSKRISSR